jgi:glycerol-3-phosphate acyltransferase PlsX
MGGDFYPLNELLGAIQAEPELRNGEILMVGNEKLILDSIKKNNLNYTPKIAHADQIVEMGDSPMNALKNKPDSSIVVGTRLVKEGKADAFVSAGNTGAVTMASILEIGRIKKVARPTIVAAFPNEKGKSTFVADVGAFVDSKPRHLLEFALLGSIYIEEIYGIRNPKIGLLNVGEEESKGYKLIADTLTLLAGSSLNFQGNVEGKDIFKGTVDLVICDGFVGNILLKFAESIIPFLKSTMRNYAEENPFNKLKALFARSPLRSALKSADYQSHGGVPLLGINGISIIGHGSSSPLAIKNMILKAKEMFDHNLISKFEEKLLAYEI